MIIAMLFASIDNDKKYAIKYADYITLSFHAVKHITTGEKLYLQMTRRLLKLLGC